MPYIGRGTDKLSNVEVLDNITFDGSSSYTLQKSGSNFTPSSANTLLVSIDGVVQAGNFTVSGSTIDFGTAVAGTSTCDFILHYGIGLITTPSDGTVTTAKLADSSVTTAKLNDASVSLAKLTATGTKDATTFLRGDNTFAAAGLNGWSEDGANNNLLPASASAGIYLGVNSATASNLLNDYEEGTWSPIIDGGTAITDGGYYRKIGKLCLIHFGNRNPSSSINDGQQFNITGLPFSKIDSNWESGSTASITFADASQSYRNRVIVGRQRSNNAVEATNRSGETITTSDPINFSMVFSTN